jgi:hypothetical protein
MVCAASLLFVAWQSAFATADGPDYYAVSAGWLLKEDSRQP